LRLRESKREKEERERGRGLIRAGNLFEVADDAGQPLPSEYGTIQTVKARFWPWLPGKVLKIF